MSEGSGPRPRGRPRGPWVLVSDRQAVPIDSAAMVRTATEVLDGEGAGEVELSLSFVEPQEMADLHVRYMGEEGPTDVLSFPLREDGLLGDVVVCPAVAEENARAAGGEPDDEVRLLVVHGVLHLLGYDHEEDEERTEMWARQERYSGVRLR